MRFVEPPRVGYRPGLDGVRALAITMVVGFHAFDWPRSGWIGVDVFFVLSGFLITALLLERGVHLRDFWTRRVRRLVPALVVLISIVVLVAHSMRSVWAALIGLSYSQNFVLAFGGSTDFIALNHLWSLAIEEQFYFLWPLLLLLVGSRVIPLAAALLVAGLGWRLWLLHGDGWVLHGGVAQVRAFFGTDTRADGIIIGCLLAGVWMKQPDLERVGRLLAVPALAVIVWVGCLALPFRQILEWPLTVACLATGVLILGALTFSMPSPVVWLGKRSYSLYLWHWPILIAVRPALLAVAVSLAAAEASYRFVEQPFRRRRAARADPEQPKVDDPPTSDDALSGGSAVPA